MIREDISKEKREQFTFTDSRERKKNQRVDKNKEEERTRKKVGKEKATTVSF